MQIKRFVAPTMAEAVALVRNEFGADAMILQTGRARQPGILGFFRPAWVAVTAGLEDDRDRAEKAETEAPARADLPVGMRKNGQRAGKAAPGKRDGQAAGGQGSTGKRNVNDKRNANATAAKPHTSGLRASTTAAKPELRPGKAQAGEAIDMVPGTDSASSADREGKESGVVASGARQHVVGRVANESKQKAKRRRNRPRPAHARTESEYGGGERKPEPAVEDALQPSGQPAREPDAGVRQTASPADKVGGAAGGAGIEAAAQGGATPDVAAPYVAVPDAMAPASANVEVAATSEVAAATAAPTAASGVTQNIANPPEANAAAAIITAPPLSQAPTVVQAPPLSQTPAIGQTLAASEVQPASAAQTAIHTPTAATPATPGASVVIKGVSPATRPAEITNMPAPDIHTAGSSATPIAATPDATTMGLQANPTAAPLPGGQAQAATPAAFMPAQVSQLKLAELATMHLIERLRQQDVAIDYLSDLEAELRLRVTQGGEAPQQYLLRSLTERIPSPMPWRFTGSPLVIPLVGPTGVGKTTTVAKLAATYGLLMGHRVGLVTADTYRVAAVEQLRTYADILNVPLEVLYSPSDAAVALERLQDRELILVDTAGRSPHNQVHMQELSAFLSELGPYQAHLVLSTNTRYTDLVEIIDSFSAHVQVAGLIMTKLDETRTYGSLFNAVRRTNKPIAFVTNGQGVPEDIQAADPMRLAGLLVGVEA